MILNELKRLNYKINLSQLVRREVAKILRRTHQGNQINLKRKEVIKMKCWFKKIFSKKEKQESKCNNENKFTRKYLRM
ncbi:hypothetical protein [Spiroplasma citri]|uniref:hypothetical protein n=1 Tax=Spiroplasma citri TaxID=2133 RepID=UPI0011BBB909|nr:hypothetical protein [Spiroplasma citri]QED25667.1 hypothetical protein FRX96_10320 [Spiroplasma citri]